MKTSIEPPMERRTALFWQGLVLLAGLMLTIGFWVFVSAMEARAFNRATGSNVSTWDAMWIELRVQDGPTSTRD